MPSETISTNKEILPNAGIQNGMTVVVVAPTFPPMRAGGADFALRLAQELAAKAVKVHVLTSEAVRGMPVEGISVHPIMRRWDWAELLPCINFVKSIQPDIVDVHFAGWMYHDHPMITFLPAFIKRFVPQVRVVTHIESAAGVSSASAHIGTRIIRRLVSEYAGRKDTSYEYGTILRDSERVIVLGQRDKDLILKMDPLAARKTVLVPPPPIMPMSPLLSAQEKEDLRRELDLSEGTSLLAYYGYTFPGKGIENLLDAMALLKNQKLKLAIIGGEPDGYVLEKLGRPAYLKEMKELSQRLGVADRVYWSGYSDASSDRASKLIRLADLCVLPFENGIALNNSSFTYCSAHGAATVSTRGAIIDPEFEHGGNIFLCAPRQAAQLADAIREVISNRDLREKLGRGALELSQSTLSWDRMTASVLN